MRHGGTEASDSGSRRAAIAAAAESRLIGGGKGTGGLPPRPEAPRSAYGAAGGLLPGPGPVAGMGQRGVDVGKVVSFDMRGGASASGRSARGVEDAGSTSLGVHQASPSSGDAHSFQAGMLQLQEMGFNSSVAYASLTSAGGNVDAALEGLLRDS